MLGCQTCLPRVVAQQSDLLGCWSDFPVFSWTGNTGKGPCQTCLPEVEAQQSDLIGCWSDLPVFVGLEIQVKVHVRQLWEAKSATTLGREVQSQQENLKFVRAQQFIPTMGKECVVESVLKEIFIQQKS